MKYLGLFAILLAGCGNPGGTDDMGEHMLPDGFVQENCVIDADCDDGQACHTWRCNPMTKVCDYTNKMCPGDDCNTGTCNPNNGMCKTTAANEGAGCVTTVGELGTCTTGFCTAIPSCWDVNNSFGSLECAKGFYNNDDNSNDPFSFSITNQLVDYDTCATGETAPEVAYQFYAPLADTEITVSLRPTGGGTVPDPDLDLMILDTTCTRNAACVNPKLAGGAYMGITPGTGKETVTFTARGGHLYYFVVDGKNGATADFHIEIEACGTCQPKPTTRLYCGMSTPGGNTALGMSRFSSYTCGASTVTGPGGEQAFLFKTVAPVAQPVKVTLTGASKAVSLVALPVDSGLQCNPAGCLAGATATGSAPNMTASVSFTATPHNSYTPGHFWVVVDAPSPGNDTTFGLQLDCLPYCAKSGNMDCATAKSKTGNNDTSSGRAKTVSAWGPTAAPCGGLSNLTGSELVYLFTKPLTTGTPNYRFTLNAATMAKKLGLVILDAGTTNPTSCDPARVCANATAVTVPASMTELASTGTHVAEAANGATAARTAVVDLITGTTAVHYYWVIVDGVNGDASDFALSIAGCM